MKRLHILLYMCLIPIMGFAQTQGEDEGFLAPKKLSWKEKSAPVNFLGMEAYGNSGDIATTSNAKRWANNSFSWELYYAASIPNYNWISFGAGLEVTGTVGRDDNGVVFDPQLDEGFLFAFQAFMNISPWFTLHFNSLGRMEFRGRYQFDFKNSVSANYGHFLLVEGVFGFFITGNSFKTELDPEGNRTYNGIDQFWIKSPSLEFLYYVQFHKNVAFRWSSVFIVNNGLFFDSGITPGEYVPMEHYARLDFMLGGGVTLWTRVQLNIANSGFSDAALFLEEGFDVQLRAGIIFLLDFTTLGKK